MKRCWMLDVDEAQITTRRRGIVSGEMLDGDFSLSRRVTKPTTKVCVTKPTLNVNNGMLVLLLAQSVQ